MEHPPIFNRETIYFYGPWLPWLCSLTKGYHKQANYSDIIDRSIIYIIDVSSYESISVIINLEENMIMAMVFRHWNHGGIRGIIPMARSMGPSMFVSFPLGVACFHGIRCQ
jgi:hypothetical protein